MSSILKETDAEVTSFSGSPQTSFKVGESSYTKYYDTGSEKWERLSGSGAPYVRPIPSLEDGATNSVRVNVVAGTITSANEVRITGSDITLAVSGSLTAVVDNIQITGSTIPFGVTGSIDARQSGSWNINGGSVGITGSGTLDVAIVSGSISTNPEVRITGSDITLGVSGSLVTDSRQSGSWNITGGSIGITGSSPLTVSLVGTAVSGSIGITGSSTLTIEGSVGLTGSPTLTVEGSVGITGSGVLDVSLDGISVTGSVGITGSVPLTVDSRQSGSWNISGGSIGITGSAPLTVSLAGTAISGSVGITGSVAIVTDARQSGSWNISGGSIGITGSETLNVDVTTGISITGSVPLVADARQSGSWNISGGSIGITGSETLNVALVGTAVSGSVGITGSVSLVVDSRQSGSWNLAGGSVGITGSITEINLADADSDNSIGISVAKKSLQSFFEATTGWETGSDIDNFGTTTTHRGTGQNFLTFDKVSGSTAIALISKTVTAIDMSKYDIHAFGHMHIYMSDISDVVNVFVRIGTDSSNYHQWDFPVANLSAGWQDLDTPISNPDSQTGSGYNLASVTWIAFGVEFSSVADALAGIITGGWAIKRAIESYLIQEIDTEISTPFMSIRDGNSQTRWDIGNGISYNYGYVRGTDGSNLTPAMDADARAGFVKVAGGSVGVTGSIGLSVTGSNVTQIVGLNLTGSVALTVDARQSGSWNVAGGSIGITGSAELSVNASKIAGINITGSTGISITGSTSLVVDSRQSGSWNIAGGSVGITGSAPLVVDSRQSGSWNVAGGSVGITGSETLEIQGSIGITGSEPLVVDARQSGSWHIDGSIGITGSEELSVNVTKIVGLNVTGSMGISITGSSNLTIGNQVGAQLGDAISVVKYLAPTSITGGLTGSVWTPASGKSIRLKKYSVSTASGTLLSLMFGSGSTINFIDGSFYMSASGSLIVNLVGCNITGSPDQKLFVSGSTTAIISMTAWGDEF